MPFLSSFDATTSELFPGVVFMEKRTFIDVDFSAFEQPSHLPRRQCSEPPPTDRRSVRWPTSGEEPNNALLTDRSGCRSESDDGNSEESSVESDAKMEDGKVSRRTLLLTERNSSASTADLSSVSPSETDDAISESSGWQSKHPEESGKEGNVPNTTFLNDANLYGSSSSNIASLEHTPRDSGEALTLMIKNIPNNYSRTSMLNEIHARGFKDSYDFFYLPIDAKTMANKGYAFINFINPDSALLFSQTFDGDRLKSIGSKKRMTVVPASLQGYEANYHHFFNTRVMRSRGDDMPLFLRATCPSLQTAQNGSRICLNDVIDSRGAKKHSKKLRFCPYCGVDAKRSYKFCASCGVGLPSM